MVSDLISNVLVNHFFCIVNQPVNLTCETVYNSLLQLSPTFLGMPVVDIIIFLFVFCLV